MERRNGTFLKSTVTQKMNCKNCGKELPEGVTICPDCDVQANETETPAAAEQVADGSVVVEPVGFSNPDFEEKPKKRGKGKLIGILAAVLAVVLAVLVAFNFSFVEGLFVKTFCSEETYFKFVEKKALSDFTDVGTVMYGMAHNKLDASVLGSEVKVEVEVGDKALDLLEDNIGTEMELDWLKNISYTVNTRTDGNNVDYGINFALGEGTLFDIRALLNISEQKGYMGILNLSDKYIDIMGSATVNEEMPELKLSPELKAALPSEAELNKLLDKYLDVALDGLGNVTKSSEKIEVGNYSQRVTVLKYKLSEKDLVKMAQKVLKELKNDDDVKDYIKDFEGYLLKEYADLMEDSDYEKDDAYKAFKEAIETALDSIDTSEADTEELLVLIDYVNGEHEIIGREIEIDDETVVSYMSAYKGSKFAFEAECDSIDLKITGEGTDKKGVITGEYKIKVGDEEILEYALEDFDTDSLEKGKLNGSIVLTPSSQLISRIFDTDDSVNSVISVLEPAIKISFESGEDSGKIAVSVMSKDENFITLTATSKVTTDGEIKLPADDSVMGNDEVTAWANSLDLSKLVDALKAAKVPDDIITVVEQYTTAIKDAGGLGEFIESYNNNYGYNNDYDYGYGYDYDAVAPGYSYNTY